MSIVTLRDVVFLNNPAKFGDPYNFKITFECIAPLKEDLEWRVIFVASPDREELDQELDDCMVGPVPPGVNVFEFEASPPNPSTIPKEDVLGVAAVILTGTYKDQEFVRVGYYQNTEYDSEELNENPPAEIDFSRLRRELANKPRVTRFSIKWDTETPTAVAQPSIPTSSATPSSNAPGAPLAREPSGFDLSAASASVPAAS
ncbi:Histone chaperone asf1 [Ceratobasidium sp. UAMH 11750]|nr:Histone chaperone asf1 [Ceratobasidium sp. UAMH 11750]